VGNLVAELSLSETNGGQSADDDLNESDDTESDFDDFADDDDIYGYDDWEDERPFGCHGMTGEQSTAAHPNKQVLAQLFFLRPMRSMLILVVRCSIAENNDHNVDPLIWLLSRDRFVCRASEQSKNTFV
jgi:hypothetical protein